MKTLHRIVSDIAKAGTVTNVEISRRELAKIKAELKRPIHSTVTTQLMAHPRHHKTRMYWPTRDTTFVLETEQRIRDDRHDEHPMIALRRKQFPRTR